MASEQVIALAPPSPVRAARAPLDRRLWLVAPLLIYLFTFYAFPVGAMMLRSVRDPHWTLAHFAEMLHSPVYLLVLWITVRISLVVTVAVLLLGYPVALVLARCAPVDAPIC